jgi:hypothetical protein
VRSETRKFVSTTRNADGWVCVSIIITHSRRDGLLQNHKITLVKSSAIVETVIPTPATYNALMIVDDWGEERGIPVIKADVSYKVFLDEYLRPLKPCIISGLTDGWTAAKEWTMFDSSTGKSIPNFPVLKEIFGKFECCVTFCDETDANGDNNSSTNKTRGKHI